MNKNSKYTAINIGPIVATFSLAKKPRELWSASYLFSHLMRCLIERVSKEAQLISPHMMDKNSLSNIGLYPDRAFFKSDEKLNIQSFINEALVVFCKETGLPKETVTNYFNIMTVSFDASTDAEGIKKANEYLNYLELQNRTKSSTSERSILDLIKIREGSPLFKIALGKTSFPVETLEEIAQNQLNLNQSIKKKSYHNYICIVQADGDNMGKVFCTLADNKSCGLSEKLMTFGRNACGIIHNYGGLPIYAGGDDLLFIAPVVGNKGEHIFDLIDYIDKEYDSIRKEVDGYNLCYEDKKIQTSMSYGISVTYHKFPLYEAWVNAREQLFVKAKKVNKEKKNAIALKFQKHSGSTLEMAFSKSENIYEAFKGIIKFMTSEELVAAVAHKLRSNESLLSTWKTFEEEKLAYRIKCFFDNIIDVQDKSTSSKSFMDEVQKLIVIFFKQYQTIVANTNRPDQFKLNYEEIYAMLRIAKFINGEEEKI